MKDFSHLLSFITARNIIEAGSLQNLSNDELVASVKFLRDRIKKHQEVIDEYEKELRVRRIAVESDN